MVRRWLFICSLLVPVWLAPVAGGQTFSLKSHPIAGGEYIAVGELARYYGLGRNLSRTANRAEYRNGFGHLALQADRREIQINGVKHWIGTPVLFARGRLWVSAVDARKCVDPLLRPDRLRSSVPIRTVVLDPGHGGSDLGTRGRSRPEKEMALDFARRVEKNLAGSGLRVLLTRATDRTMSLEDRVDFSSAKKADMFVSLHFNAGGTAHGIETYCLPPPGSPPTATSRPTTTGMERYSGNRYDSQNALLAHLVQYSLLRATGANDRGVRRARFYVLRQASCPAILVEAGFLSNQAEEQKILKPEYRETLAKAVAEGIVMYKKAVEKP